MSHEPNVMVSAFLPEACPDSSALLLHNGTLIGDCFRCADVPNELLHYRLVSSNRKGVGQLCCLQELILACCDPGMGRK